jgi:hypothetical protein
MKKETRESVSFDTHIMGRYFIGVADVGPADEQEMRLFSRDGFYGVVYFHRAFVVYDARAVPTTFTTRAGRENDGVRAADCFRER